MNEFCKRRQLNEETVFVLLSKVMSSVGDILTKRNSSSLVAFTSLHLRSTTILFFLFNCLLISPTSRTTIWIHSTGKEPIESIIIFILLLSSPDEAFIQVLHETLEKLLVNASGTLHYFVLGSLSIQKKSGSEVSCFAWKYPLIMEGHQEPDWSIKFSLDTFNGGKSGKCWRANECSSLTTHTSLSPRPSDSSLYAHSSSRRWLFQLHIVAQSETQLLSQENPWLDSSCKLDSSQKLSCKLLLIQTFQFHSLDEETQSVPRAISPSSVAFHKHLERFFCLRKQKSADNSRMWDLTSRVGCLRWIWTEKLENFSINWKFWAWRNLNDLLLHPHRLARWNVQTFVVVIVEIFQVFVALQEDGDCLQ